MKAMLLVVLLVAADCAARPAPACDGLTITGVNAIGPHQMARFSACGYPEGAGIVWDVSPEDKCDILEQGPNLYFTGPPGMYVIKALAVSSKDGKTVITRARSTLTITGGDLPPKMMPPAPPIVPPPPPPLTPPGKKPSPAKALMKLRVGSSGCTATVVGPQRIDGRWDILTASHCLGSSKSGTVTTQEGKVIKVTKTAQDGKADLCWLVTDERVDDLPFAELATAAPAAGVEVWHAGYGIDKPGNTERGTVSAAPNGDGQIRYVLSVSPGDSGGGIFRADTGELLGAVCCTQGFARLTSMWAGSCLRAAELRPRSMGLLPILDLGGGDDADAAR